MDSLLSAIQKIEKPEKIVSIFSALAATGLALYCTKKLVTSRHSEEDVGYEKIPVPKGAYFYLGHLPCLGDLAGPVVTKWHEEYGPLINIKMGVQNWVFIGDANMAHDIFVTHGAATSGRPFFTFGSGIVGEGGRGIVFNDYGKMWKVARSAALNILSPTAVHGFHDVLWEESGRCVDQLIEQTLEHGEVDPLPYIRLSAVNIMLTVIYGIPTLKSPEDEFYKKIVFIIETGMRFIGPFEDISSFLPILSFLDIIFRKERRMKNFWDNVSYPLFSKLVEEARKSDKDSLTKKIDSIKEDLGLDEKNVRTILSEVLVGGSDTVSVTTIWTYVVLCNYPDVQQKLIYEIDEFIKANKRPPTFEDRLQLPYYNAVQKECIRFRPASFFGVPQKATKDVVYKNYLIPKGTILVSNLHTLHFDKDFYDQPEKFIPERFLDNTKTLYAASNGNVNNRDQFVFGWGRRLCPGIAMAENELFNNVTKLLTCCTIEPAKSSTGESIYPDLNTFIDKGATIHPADVKMRFVQRESRLVK